MSTVADIKAATLTLARQVIARCSGAVHSLGQFCRLNPSPPLLFAAEAPALASAQKNWIAK